MKRVLLIGNRFSVLNGLPQLPLLRLTTLVAPEGSSLASASVPDGCQKIVFARSGQAEILSLISRTEFDFLISNGCPFIIPVSKIRRPHQLFLNVHPSLLPEGRGPSPVNAVILNQQTDFGATLHYMDDGVDTGPIIHQVRMSATNDLDLALLYHFTFMMEERAFVEGMKKLIDTGFLFKGDPQSGTGSYYSRKRAHQRVDFSVMSDEEIVRRISAFGIRSQGVEAETSEGIYCLFDAVKIVNPDLLDLYAAREPGSLLLEHDQSLLIKSRDGVIKVRSFTKVT